MALNPPFVVQIERKPGGSFAEIMNAVRIWLDHRDIHPTSFKPVVNARSGLSFEIGFNSEDEAHLFEREFA